jgi:hypothetical protein
MKFNKSALLAALKPKTELVDVEGFGKVGIIQLTVGEVEKIRADLKAADNADQFGLHLVLLSVVDDAGARVFDASDLPGLIDAGHAAMDALVAKALQVNGFKKLAEAKN